MKRLMIATTAAALLAGVSVASAQSWRYDGPYERYRAPGVGVQIGPFGAGVYADEPSWGYSRPYNYDTRSDGTTETMRAFRSQEVWPQSPPGGS